MAELPRPDDAADALAVAVCTAHAASRARRAAGSRRVIASLEGDGRGRLGHLARPRGRRRRLPRPRRARRRWPGLRTGRARKLHTHHLVREDHAGALRLPQHGGAGLLRAPHHRQRRRPQGRPGHRLVAARGRPRAGHPAGRRGRPDGRPRRRQAAGRAHRPGAAREGRRGRPGRARRAAAPSRRSWPRSRRSATPRGRVARRRARRWPACPPSASLEDRVKEALRALRRD